MTPSPTRRRGGWIAVLLCLALAVAACSNGSSGGEAAPTTVAGSGSGATTVPGATAPRKDFNDAQFSGEPTEGGSIIFGVESTIATLDPAGNLAQPSDIDMALAIYDPLVTFDAKGKYAPALATKWVSSADLKTWTLTVRDDVTFSDGTPFNAEAVQKNFERYKDPATACTCKPVVDLIDSVKATNPTTVVFTLTGANAFFISALTGPIGFMASPTAEAKEGKDYGRHPIGTGPFTLQSFDALVLKKNPNYWQKDDQGRQLPYLDQITVKPIPDTTVRLQSLKAGDIDAFQTADTGNVADAVKDKSLKVQKVTGSSATITIFNLRKPPFNDVRMRQAVAYGIDRAELNNVLYKGARQLAYSPFATDSPYYADIAWPKHDNAKAVSLLKAAEADGVSPNATATCIATPEGRTGLSITSKQGEKNGLHLTNEFLDQGAYVNKVIGATHDFTIGCFRSPQIADADGLFNALHTGGSANVGGYSNATVDKALEDIRKTSDEKEHIRLLKVVQEQIAVDIPALPLLYDLFGNIYNPDISGFPVPEANSLGAIKFTTLYRVKK